MTTRSIVVTLVLALAMTACEKTPASPAISLHDAIVMRDADAVRAHLAAGTDVNAAEPSGVTPLIAATTSGQADVIRSLLAAGADINARGPEDGTALIFAIQAEQPEIALLLLEQDGIDVEAREAHGSTPLVEAVVFGQLQVAEALLEKGADIDTGGPLGRTPLYVAATGLDPKKIQWLLEGGADADARSDEGQTPLHAAAICPLSPEDFGGASGERALDLLLEAARDVNASDAGGRTPLHHAVGWADPWIIERLLGAGASPDALDENGGTPVCYLAYGEMMRPRTIDEALAVVSLFRDAGLTDETAIDDRNGTLSMLVEWLRKQDR